LSELHYVCLLCELPEGRPAAFTVADYEIVLIKTAGQVYALEDNCSHQDFPLSHGQVLTGERIKCKAHGAEFCLKSGKALAPPAFAPVRAYPLKVENGEVWVDIG